jgi:hypothetical protein
MSKFGAMRSALESASSLLCDVAESGLDPLWRYGEALSEEAARLVALGLEGGGALLSGLAAEGVKGRLEMDWDYEGAAGCFAAAWSYIALCLGRLDYLEAAGGPDGPQP